MSTHKHLDRLCVIVALLMAAATLLLMCTPALGIAAEGISLGYEDRLFDITEVHTIDISMEHWDSFLETCENEEYSLCNVTIDGETFKNVGIRAKGNTSLSSVSAMNSDRYSFKIEFDQYNSSMSYHGLDKLSLNNLIQDNTFMKDFLVYQMMGRFGVAAPLCSFVYITVNGEDWGLYLAVEGVEDSFLQRNYGSDSGDLYKPDSLSFGGGRGNGKDFNMEGFDFESVSDGDLSQRPEDFEKPEGFEMPDGFDGTSPGMQMPSGDQMPGESQRPQMGEGQTGGSPNIGGNRNDFGSNENFGGMGGMGSSGGMGGMGSSDVKLQYIDDDPNSYSNIFDSAKTAVTANDQKRLIQSLKTLSSYENLESALDIDAVLRYFVVHNFVVNGDSYTGSMIHNYYLYEEDGLLSMIPWDYNLAFGTFQNSNASSAVNESIDDGATLTDRPMIAWIFSSEEYTALYHQYFSEFIDSAFNSGYFIELVNSTAALISPYVERDPTKFCTAEEFEAGVDAIIEFCLLRAESVSAQLAGDDTAIDTGSLNLSDMGTMGNTMGNTMGGGMPTQAPGQSGAAGNRQERPRG